jgi:hypothetical protein
MSKQTKFEKFMEHPVVEKTIKAAWFPVALVGMGVGWLFDKINIKK